MSKYSDEFKLIIVKEYLEGPLGYTLLAKKYDIPSPSPIERWVNSYKALVKKDYVQSVLNKFILFNLN